MQIKEQRKKTKNKYRKNGCILISILRGNFIFDLIFRLYSKNLSRSSSIKAGLLFLHPAFFFDQKVEPTQSQGIMALVGSGKYRESPSTGFTK
jgi:hypothetical protein